MTLAYKVRCADCGQEWTEIYPDGFEGDESYSAAGDPKSCDCESQSLILHPVAVPVEER